MKRADNIVDTLAESDLAVHMKKGYQGDELWSAVNPLTGKRELIDPEGELIPGETVIKLYYCNRLDGYVTIPGASLFRVAADHALEAIDH